jgi:hypothetical protein
MEPNGRSLGTVGMPKRDKRKRGSVLAKGIKQGSWNESPQSLDLVMSAGGLAEASGMC